MDQIEKVLNSEWREAASLSCVSGYAVKDQGPALFHLKSGASIGSKQQYAVDGLRNNLSLISPDGAAFMIHDALILGNGFIIYSPDGLVNESRYLANNFERRVEMSLRDDVIVLDESIVWIVAGNASSRNNYWHWFAQILPAILHSRDFAQSVGKVDFGLVTGRLKGWQIESLLVLGIPHERIVQVDIFQSAKAKTCFYSSLLSGVSVFAHNRYREEIRELFIQWAGGIEAGDEKLLISRKDTKKRPLLNEEALQSALMKDGFRVVAGGTMTLREQVQVFHAASIIVAPHGAGSTNVMFGQRGGRYIELSQLSYPNAGPLSLCKTSGMLAWVDLFEDDGKGQGTEGWTAPIDIVMSTIASAEAAVS